MDVPEPLRALRVADLAADQELGIAEDRRHRRAQCVGRRRDEDIPAQVLERRGGGLRHGRERLDERRVEGVGAGRDDDHRPERLVVRPYRQGEGRARVAAEARDRPRGGPGDVADQQGAVQGQHPVGEARSPRALRGETGRLQRRDPAQARRAGLRDREPREAGRGRSRGHAEQPRGPLGDRARPAHDGDRFAQGVLPGAARLGGPPLLIVGPQRAERAGHAFEQTDAPEIEVLPLGGGDAERADRAVAGADRGRGERAHAASAEHRDAARYRRPRRGLEMRRPPAWHGYHEGAGLGEGEHGAVAFEDRECRFEDVLGTVLEAGRGRIGEHLPHGAQRLEPGGGAFAWHRRGPDHGEGATGLAVPHDGRHGDGDVRLPAVPPPDTGALELVDGAVAVGRCEHVLGAVGCDDAQDLPARLADPVVGGPPGRLGRGGIEEGDGAVRAGGDESVDRRRGRHVGGRTSGRRAVALQVSEALGDVCCELLAWEIFCGHGSRGVAGGGPPSHHSRAGRRRGHRENVRGTWWLPPNEMSVGT